MNHRRGTFPLDRCARKAHRFASPTRRGLTFLEIVLSVVLLAIATSMIMSAINNMLEAQGVHRQRLGAAEIANRLTLQYLDDKRTLPAQGLPVVYGRERYRWDYTERPVSIVTARPEAIQSRNASNQSLNRLVTVNFRVWLSEENGGSYGYDPLIPSFTLSRVVNPTALRNPDTIDRMLKDPEAYREFLANLTGGGTPTPPAGNTPNTPGRNTPRTPGKTPTPGGQK